MNIRKLKTRQIIIGAILITLIIYLMLLLGRENIIAVDKNDEPQLKSVPSTVKKTLSSKQEIKVGQRWIFTSGNPFRTDSIVYQVLDIKGNYVQYINVDHIKHKNDPFYVESCTERWFRIGTKLINDQ
jgi:hypothetical protein